MDILFDLDGTLTDPRDGMISSIQCALGEVGGPRLQASELVKYIGPPLHKSFAQMLGCDDAVLIQRALDSYRRQYSAAGFAQARVYEGIPEALNSLTRAGHKLWVETSKPTVYALKVVRHFGLARYFAEVLGSELNGDRSSKTGLIAHALNTGGGSCGAAGSGSGGLREGCGAGIDVDKDQPTRALLVSLSSHCRIRSVSPRSI